VPPRISKYIGASRSLGRRTSPCPDFPYLPVAVTRSSGRSTTLSMTPYETASLELSYVVAVGVAFYFLVFLARALG
jgi:hypothetical protein